ncbi:MAG: hypothetical protein O3B43_06720 [Chloroflexi bacterium]|nr:hypothetical protein [Chloroflexota bacterium]
MRTIVFGGKAKLNGVWVEERYVAKYLAAHPNQMIGLMSIDPTQEGWEREMLDGRDELGLLGIKLLPLCRLQAGRCAARSTLALCSDE